MNKPGGIYIHIPFCVRKCNYCAFLSMPQNEEVRAGYVDDLIREIKLRGRMAEGKTFDTVYFGGGTPSILTATQIEAILSAVRESYDIADDAEITLEANPGTLGDETAAAEKLGRFREMGINRLSMGVQSMNDERLKLIGRIHDVETVKRDYRLAREAGFDNINLDIIFSIPEMKLADGRTAPAETTDDALEDIRQIASLGPEHVSFYSLQLEEGTPFFAMWEKGDLFEASDVDDRETYHRGSELLEALGYDRYEISNYAKPGRESRHNSKYWNMTDYLAAGLGASGFLEGVRYKNLSDMQAYHEAVNGDILPSEEVYTNTREDNVSEAVFTGLRRNSGISYDELAQYLGATGDAETAFWEYYHEVRAEAEDYVREGYLEIDENGLRLTNEGIDISNTIMALFV